MKNLLFVLWFLTGVSLSSGCQSLVNHGSSKHHAGVYQRIAQASTSKERDALLDELVSGRNQTERVVKFIEGWGENGDYYDLAVLNLLRNSGAGRYSYLEIVIGDPVSDAILLKLRQQPELLDQIYWEIRPYAGEVPVAPEAITFSRVAILYRHTFESFGSGISKIYSMLVFCSATDQDHFLVDLNDSNFEQRWTEAKAWMKDNLDYLYFDEASGTYQVDENAKKEKKPVSWERQEWTSTPTLLPKRQNSGKNNIENVGKTGHRSQT